MDILIIIVGVILIIGNYKKVFNEESTFDQQFDLKKKDEFAVKLIELRSEMGESFLLEQQEIEELKSKLDKVNEDINCLKEELKDIHLKKTFNKKINDKKDSVDSSKVDMIRKLLTENMSIEDICHKTGAGKGEVLLIKELFP